MRKENMLLAIRISHTLIWLRLGVPMITLVIGEGIVLLIFKMYCPLTILARKHSDSKKDNFDIFLPNWLAKYNKIIFTSLFVLGLVLVLFRVML